MCVYLDLVGERGHLLLRVVALAQHLARLDGLHQHLTESEQSESGVERWAAKRHVGGAEK